MVLLHRTVAARERSRPGHRPALRRAPISAPPAARARVRAAVCAAVFTSAITAAIGPRARAQEPPPPQPPVRASFGFDVRIRDETLHNLLDFNTSHNGGPASDSHYYRFRVRTWTKATLRCGASLHARITAEPIKYLDPYIAPTETEIILDNAYLEIPRFGFLPVRLRAGRMDLPLGDGFLVMDGGPGDGSRSYYENAIVIDLDGEALGFSRTALALIAIRNLVRDPIVLANDQERPLVEKDETAFGLHMSTESIGEKTEILYMYKEEMRGDAALSPPPNTRVHTLGYRMTGALPAALSFAAEGAYQFGSRYDWRTGEKLADQRGLGMHGWAQRAFVAPLMPTVKAGALVLSGDDPSTETYEGWSPIFSRWPMWSSLYIYSLIPEQGRVAYWQNLVSFHAGISLRLSATIDLSYTYRHLRALHALGGAGSSLFGTGLTRGDLHIWQLTAKLSGRTAMQFLAERMAPGDFYAGPRDDAYFLRWEVTVQK
jgi:hypothetical protein